MFVGVAYGAAVVLTGALVLLVRRMTAKKPQGKKRSMSFGSKTMANGVFPDPVEAWRTIINTVIYLDNCPSVEAVAKKCRGLMHYDRFRSALSVGSDGCFFTDITDDINVEKDLVRSFEVESEEELREKVDELCSKEMGIGEKVPLFVMIRLHNTGTGKSAVLVRLHHAIGDGMALIGAMTHVFEDVKGNPFSLDVPRNAGGGTNRAFNLSTMWKFVTSTLKIIALPLTPYDSNIAFSTPHRPTISMKDKTRRTVYFPVLNLDFVKELKRRANVTVNDVLLACTAGAIRRYCQMKDDPLFASRETAKKVQVRALMPVAFPRSQAELANPSKVSWVLTQLHVILLFNSSLSMD